MKIKTMSKIIVALVIIATILSAVSMVFGSNLDSGVNMPGTSNVAAEALRNPVERIIGLVQLICYAAAVILLVILGVKFMTASPDGKAEIKKSAIIYVVGAILVFAAGALLNLLKNVGTNVVGQ